MGFEEEFSHTKLTLQMPFINEAYLKEIAKNDNLKQLLTEKGWKNTYKSESREVWIKNPKANPEQGVVLVRADFADYTTRLYESIRIIADLEESDQLSILKSLEWIHFG